MNKDEIFNEVKLIINDRLDIEKNEITLDKTLQDMKADSLDSVEVIMEVEKVFDIAIPDKDMEKFSNIQSIVDYVYNHIPVEKRS